MVGIKESPRKKEDKVIEYEITRDDLGVFEDFIDEIGIIDRNLDYFFYNLKTVKILMDNKQLFFKNQPLAEYSAIHNVILCSKKNYKIGIMHEIFHMASTHVSKNTCFCGFSQVSLNSNDSIGIGLNEGYTAILDERYFMNYDHDKKRVIGNTYPILKVLASYIESIIGTVNMENCYFTADLYSIYNYLSNIMGEEETLTFIKNIDAIYYNCDGMCQKTNVDKTMKAFQDCMRFIGITQLRLNERLKYEDKITEDDYDSNLIKILKIFKSELRLLGKCEMSNKYKITDDEIKKIYENNTHRYTTLN